MNNQMFTRKRSKSMDEDAKIVVVPRNYRNDDDQCQSSMDNDEGEFDKESFANGQLPRTSNESMGETIEIVIIPRFNRNDDGHDQSQSELDEEFINESWNENESKSMSTFKKLWIGFMIACIGTVCISKYYFSQTMDIDQANGRNLKMDEFDVPPSDPEKKRKIMKIFEGSKRETGITGKELYHLGQLCNAMPEFKHQLFDFELDGKPKQCFKLGYIWHRVTGGYGERYYALSAPDDKYRCWWQDEMYGITEMYKDGKWGLQQKHESEYINKDAYADVTGKIKNLTPSTECTDWNEQTHASWNHLRQTRLKIITAVKRNDNFNVQIGRCCGRTRYSNLHIINKKYPKLDIRNKTLEVVLYGTDTSKQLFLKITLTYKLNVENPVTRENIFERSPDEVKFEESEHDEDDPRSCWKTRHPGISPEGVAFWHQWSWTRLTLCNCTGCLPFFKDRDYYEYKEGDEQY